MVPARTPTTMLLVGLLLTAGVFPFLTTATAEAPVFEPLAPVAVAEGALLEVTLVATDADGDEIAFSAVELPAGATLEGALFSWRPNHTQAGNHSVEFIATDGETQATQTLDIVVVENSAPIAVWSHTTLEAGRLATLNANGSRDPDNSGDLTYEWDLDASDGFQADLVGKVVEHTFAEPGTYDVTLRVTDGVGASVELARTLGVDDYVTTEVAVLDAVPDVSSATRATVSVAQWDGSAVEDQTVEIRVFYKPVEGGQSRLVRSFTVRTGDDGSTDFFIPKDTPLGNLPGDHFVQAFVAVTETALGNIETAVANADYTVEL